MGPIPNPQSPIPNPHKLKNITYFLYFIYIKYLNKLITKKIMSINIITDYFGDDDNNNDSKQSKTEVTLNNNFNVPESENTPNEIIIDNNENSLETSNDIKIISLEKELNSFKIKLPVDISSEKDRANKLTQKLVQKTKRNEKMKFEEFFIKKRHYLIMSDGGKPVYSRYGDPIENNSIFATLSAMITKFTIFNSNESDKEFLNVITNEKNKIAFLKKGQLIFIALSKKNDCTSLLFSQLEYLYNQLMSILTSSFYSKLEDNPSKCLSTMSGTENLFEQMIQYTSKSFPSLFNSYQVFNFFEQREKLNKIAEEFRGDALYCIIMTPYEIISLARSNQIDVVSSDLVLIQNLIYSQEMLRTQESYVPICLPGISEQGYIQFYSHFSEENIGIIFVTENMDPMCFVKFKEQYNKLYQKLINENYIEKIIDNFRINNNILGEYSLLKHEEENKINEEMSSPEFLIHKLFEKFGKSYHINFRSSNTIKFEKNRTFSSSEALRESLRRTESGFDMQGKNEKIKNKYFEGIKYGVVLNKKLKQYVLFNFDMDFRVYNKTQKKLIHEYNLLFDKANEEENEEFFFIKKTKEFINVIDCNENFVGIFTCDFFGEYDDIGKKTKELIKYIKKNEQKYFILFK